MKTGTTDTLERDRLAELLTSDKALRAAVVEVASTKTTRHEGYFDFTRRVKKLSKFVGKPMLAEVITRAIELAREVPIED